MLAASGNAARRLPVRVCPIRCAGLSLAGHPPSPKACVPCHERHVATLPSGLRIDAILDRHAERVSIGTQVSVVAWVRSARSQKTHAFLELNDGSSASNLQVVAEPGLVAGVTTGASVCVEGTLVASPKPGQAVELAATSINIIGTSPASFPLQKKSHSAEFLRDMAHLRARTGAFGATMRIRSAVLQAIHAFFARQRYVLVSTPILTGNDCEGAGELFSVLPRSDLLEMRRQLREGGAKGGARPPPDAPPPVPEEARFFGREAFLTVSGQLHLEAFALGLGRAYTLGPTFRAEDSNTSRHAAEFWMLEAEVAPGSMADAVRARAAAVPRTRRPPPAFLSLACADAAG